MSENLTYLRAVDEYRMTIPINECKLKLFEGDETQFGMEGVILEHPLYRWAR